MSYVREFRTQGIDRMCLGWCAHPAYELRAGVPHARHRPDVQQCILVRGRQLRTKRGGPYSFVPRAAAGVCASPRPRAAPGWRGRGQGLARRRVLHAASPLLRAPASRTPWVLHAHARLSSPRVAFCSRGCLFWEAAAACALAARAWVCRVFLFPVWLPPNLLVRLPVPYWGLAARPLVGDALCGIPCLSLAAPPPLAACPGAVPLGAALR